MEMENKTKVEQDMICWNIYSIHYNRS